MTIGRHNFWYEDTAKEILGRRLIDAVKAGWWDDSRIECRRCVGSGYTQTYPTVALYHYNHTYGRGYDWFYCETCFRDDPRGSYGDSAVVYRRDCFAQPNTIQLKVIVKGSRNGTKA